jgi:hypothetical protein
MVFLAVPDKLNIMTYVYHLRAQLTGSSWQLPSRPIAKSTAAGRQQSEHHHSGSSSAEAPEHRDWLSPLCKLTTSEKAAVNTEFSRNSHRQRQSKSPDGTSCVLNNAVLTSSDSRSSADRRPAQSKNSGEIRASSGAESTVRSDAVPADGLMAPLMTRKQLLNPFDSDSDSEDRQLRGTSDKTEAGAPHPLPVTSASGPTACSTFGRRPNNTETDAGSCTSTTPVAHELSHPAVATQEATESPTSGGESAVPSDESSASRKQSVRSRGQRKEELRDRARTLLEQARCSTTAAPAAAAGTCAVAGQSDVGETTEDARKRELRERARRLIAESRGGRSGAVELITVNGVGGAKSSGANRPRRLNSTKLQKVSTAAFGQNNASVDALGTRRTLAKEVVTHVAAADGRMDVTYMQGTEADCQLSPGDYIQSEIESLERCLRRLDERAIAVEWSLRHAMTAAGNGRVDDGHEARLTSEWFALVDERNELVHRVEQLNAVAHEHDLERRFAMLSMELQRLMASGGGGEDECDDEDRSRREELLLAELVSIVNQRDEIVQQLDAQPRCDDCCSVSSDAAAAAVSDRRASETGSSKSRLGIVNNSCALQ